MNECSISGELFAILNDTSLSANERVRQILLSEHFGRSFRQEVLCDFFEHVIPVWEGEHKGDDRAQLLLNSVRQCIRNEEIGRAHV